MYLYREVINMNRKLTIIIFLSFALVFTNKAYSQTLGGQSSLDKYVQKQESDLLTNSSTGLMVLKCILIYLSRQKIVAKEIS